MTYYVHLAANKALTSALLRSPTRIWTLVRTGTNYESYMSTSSGPSVSKCGNTPDATQQKQSTLLGKRSRASELLATYITDIGLPSTVRVASTKTSHVEKTESGPSAGKDIETSAKTSSGSAEALCGCTRVVDAFEAFLVDFERILECGVRAGIEAAAYGDPAEASKDVVSASKAEEVLSDDSESDSDDDEMSEGGQ